MWLNSLYWAFISYIYLLYSPIQYLYLTLILCGRSCKFFSLKFLNFFFFKHKILIISSSFPYLLLLHLLCFLPTSSSPQLLPICPSPPCFLLIPLFSFLYILLILSSSPSQLLLISSASPIHFILNISHLLLTSSYVPHLFLISFLISSLYLPNILLISSSSHP